MNKLQKAKHMNKTYKLLTLICISFSLKASSMPLITGNSVVPHDKAYYTHQLRDKDIELIYTKENLPFAQQALSVELPLHKDYEQFFNWELDETLYVGLISDNNQIANGFSTQYPNNRQINYVGGAEMIDYFSCTSWLNTLLYHETAHNYQVNVKGSRVSQMLHSFLGNGSVVFPFFISPNLLENSFMLEGNAVLNESWHGNGGRLYSGRFKAQTLLQAQADQLKPAYLYNNKLAFPYGEIIYIQGGYYNLYMAEKYGLEKINSYFKAHSMYWYWPFLTNRSMRNSVGITFEESVKDFEAYQKELAKDFVSAKGDIIAHSQFFKSLNHSKDEIFFIINESGNRAPELIRFNKKSLQSTKTRGSYVAGKVLKVNGEYFTQGSMKISPIRIRQGLFNSDGYIKNGTDSKMIQGYLSDGTMIYFDVASSYSEPQLYVGNTFYGQVNSSVIIDSNDNLYYFKQQGKKRTLYKNKTPLYSYEGFYGIVSDVDSLGNIYFIANSQLGTSLYRYKKEKIERISPADNIVEARLINDNKVLLSALGAKDYYYLISDITPTDTQPYNTKLFFETAPYYGAKHLAKEEQAHQVTLEKSYYSFLNMHYSGTDIKVSSSENGLSTSLNINIGDPLTQNSANIFISRDDTNVTIAGAGYSNAQYLLNYTLIAYGVVDKNNRDDIKESGIMAGATLPFLRTGYWSGAVGMSYFQDYDTASREPLSATLDIAEFEQYGISLYANKLYALKLYGVQERKDEIVGASAAFKHDLPAEFYIGASLKYSSSSANTSVNERGVKLSSTILNTDFDPSTINMPNLSNSTYLKSAGYAQVSLKKVFNLSAYFFTFPFSLQREALYMKYRYYDLEDFAATKSQANEATVGMTFMTVFVNNFILPMSLEYIHNDASIVQNQEIFRFSLGTSF